MNASAVRAAVLVAATVALAPASALARHLGPDELGPETRVGVFNQADEVDVGARDDSSAELQWGIPLEGCEVAVGSSRYLAPEPALRDPKWQVVYAKTGHSLPAYSYAGNNPISLYDKNGKLFVSDSPAFWESVTRVSSNPNLAPYIEEMERSSTIYEVNNVGPAIPLQYLIENGGGLTRGIYNDDDNNRQQCSQHVRSEIDMTWVKLFMNAKRGLDTNLDQATAHELGEAWSTTHPGTDPALDWENAMRVPGPYRMVH